MAVLNEKMWTLAKITKLKASSLVEVLVAMVILLAILAIAGMAYVRLAAQQPDRQVRIEHRLAQLAATAKAQGDFTDTALELPEWGLEVVRQCSTYRTRTDIIRLSLTAYTPHGKVFAEYRELVFVGNGKE